MNQSNNPFDYTAALDVQPVPYKKRACVNCHDSKVRCEFTDSLTKCDRCIKQNRECVPHVSMQGRRPNGTKKNRKKREKTNKASVSPASAPSAVVGKKRDDAGTQYQSIGMNNFQGNNQSQNALNGNQLHDANMMRFARALFPSTSADYQSCNGTSSYRTSITFCTSGASYEPNGTSSSTNSSQISYTANNASQEAFRQAQDASDFDDLCAFVSNNDDIWKASSSNIPSMYGVGNADMRGSHDIASQSSISKRSQISTAGPTLHNSNGFAATAPVAAARFEVNGTPMSEYSSSSNSVHESSFRHSQSQSIKTSPSNHRPISILGSRGSNEVKVSVASRSANQQGYTGIVSSELPLQQWIKHALHAVGDNGGTKSIAALPYLEGSIKIAMAIAKQINQAEELTRYGINTKIDVLSSAADWAARIVVILKKDEANATRDGNEQIESFLQAFDEQHCNGQQVDNSRSELQHSVGGNSAESSLDGGLNENLDSEFESFFKTFCVDSFEEEDATRRYSDTELTTTVEGMNGQEVNEQLESFLESFEAKRADAKVRQAPRTLPDDTKMPASRKMESSLSDCFQVLDVESANIQSREVFNGYPIIGEEIHHNAKHLFCLGLVLYELFSGGESPPPKLRALSASNGAFISLSTFTSVEQADEVENKGDSKRRHGTSGSKQSVDVCQISCDYLGFIGVPGPICDLILNLLGPVYGDMAEHESYTSIIDVISDLQLMLDKPKFLQGLNTDRVSMTGLQLDEFVIPRNAEYESIISCYHRCTSRTELVIISGESGSGKSFLSRNLSKHIEAEGGIFVTAKFDQASHLGAPFAAIRLAANQYCDVLLERKESDWAKSVINRLQTALGHDVHHLTPVIPKLGGLLSGNRMGHLGSTLGQSTNAMGRLHYLICQFVDAISSAPDVPVTICLDDMQWADHASIALLDQVLRREHKSLFFIACCRDYDSMAIDHPFLKMIENVHSFGVNATVVNLTRAEEGTLSNAVSDLLCLSPRVVRPLCQTLIKRTQGNLLFISRLLFSLYHDGLLFLDLRRKRWLWDESKIISTKLPDNVALIITNEIGKLPVEVQLALHTMSMFGASVKTDWLEFLESKLGLMLSEELKIAEKEGLVSNINGCYAFCHDRIQEACTAMISEQNRRGNHLVYGRCLISHYFDTSKDDVLFMAVNQINSGGVVAVSDAQEYVSFAKYNVIAGKKAMEMAEFISAHSLFNHGIAFLRSSENYWQEQYQLSLEIFEHASKCALATGDTDSLQLHSDQIFRNATSFDDKLNAHFFVMSSLCSRSKMQDALHKGLTILSQLGEGLPNLSRDELDRQTRQTIEFAMRITPEHLVNYKLMADPKKIVVMRFLAALLFVSHNVKPALYPYFVLKMINITFLHGLSKHAPITFASFGSYLAASGNIELGRRYVMMALSLLEKIDSESAGDVICLAATLKCHLEPAQAAIEFFIEGEKKAMSVGNVHFTCFNRLQHLVGLFWTGTHLQSVSEKLSLASKFMKEQEYKNALAFIMATQRKVSVLMGCKDESVSTNQVSRTVLNDSIPPRHLMHFHFQEMYLTMLGLGACQSNLKDASQKFFEHNPESHILMFTNSIRTFIAGLASFQVYRETRDQVWMDRGSSTLQGIKYWAERGCKWNFLHKMHLLQAEERYSIGDFDAAKKSYKEAIAASEAHRFTNDLALSYELAAHFYMTTGDLHASLEHYRHAHETYARWGAAGKATQLFGFINERFSRQTGT